MNRRVFGEWLSAPVRGRMLRLVVEAGAGSFATVLVRDAVLKTDPSAPAEIEFQPEGHGFPWSCGVPPSAPSVTWRYGTEVEFRSLTVEHGGPEAGWIRRYRIEVSDDGVTWRLAVASRLLDALHRQPCALESRLALLESSELPSGKGTAWADLFYQDFLTRTVQVLGPDYVVPEWLSSRCFVSAATSPYAFQGVYNPGDVANFNSLIAAIFCPELAVETEKIFVDQVHHYGFLPAVMSPGHRDDRAFALDYSGLNWPPSCYRDISAWVDDPVHTASFSDACQKWAAWLRQHRDPNGDGWLELGMNGCDPASEDFRRRMASSHPDIALRAPAFWDHVARHNPDLSAFQAAIYELSTDDAPVYVHGRHRGLRFDPELCILSVHYLDAQLFYALLSEFISFAHRSAGRPGPAQEYARQAHHYRDLVARQCWDTDTGFYYDREMDSGALRTFVKHVAAFLPMLMGIPTHHQARRMVDHLMNPEEFWTEYPVPSISRDSPDYAPWGYWSGRSWPPFNFLVLRALLNYGFFAEADALLDRWMKHVASCIDRPSGVQSLRAEGRPEYDARRTSIPDVEWIVPENWNSETGEVHGSGGLTWGGLWIPAVICRHFWPVDGDRVLIRPGGAFALEVAGRFAVRIDGTSAEVNGRTVRMDAGTTYLHHLRSGHTAALTPGRADPVAWAGADGEAWTSSA